ncbi:tetraacyldisaccharide 4'-kinase [Steroidobacter denitrificans]|uniref:Tetraacyldisaccharide 4'-kinase n=2 Tax=Steroidobacter denitrificans TaxID=465721 RepID=A0A127FCC0_STEDE|nr:tetraacyldisaccharide 4'-kinase [Steroidobacter denitrificans]
MSWLMLPAAGLFGLVVALRREAYRCGLLRSHRLARPVIVIGNLTVGGTGKTPFTIWLAQALQSRGVRVGIVLRGYGGRSAHWPREVADDGAWEEVGDEAVLLARRTGAIVVAGPDRVAAAQHAIERGAHIVLSDDGLQHYRLARDLEIVVIDARRGLGNGYLLPAGPLREPQRRLSRADLIVLMHRAGERPQSRAEGTRPAGGPQISPAIRADAYLVDAVCIATGERRALTAFRGAPVHALAGIGHPQAFFRALAACRLDVLPHALPDHAPIERADIDFTDGYPVLMTEKDAVKCTSIADRRHWAVRMDIDLEEQSARIVSTILDQVVGP